MMYYSNLTSNSSETLPPLWRWKAKRSQPQEEGHESPVLSVYNTEPPFVFSTTPTALLFPVASPRPPPVNSHTATSSSSSTEYAASTMYSQCAHNLSYPSDAPLVQAGSGEQDPDHSRRSCFQIPFEKRPMIAGNPYIAKEALALKQARNRVYALIDASEDPIKLAASSEIQDKANSDGSADPGGLRNTRANAKRKRKAVAPGSEPAKDPARYELAYGYGEKDVGVELFEELEKEELELQKLWVEGPVTTGAVAGYMRAKKRLLQVVALVYHWEETKARLALEKGSPDTQPNSPLISEEIEQHGSVDAYAAPIPFAGHIASPEEAAEGEDKPPIPAPLEGRRRSLRSRTRNSTPNIDLSRPPSAMDTHLRSIRSRSRLDLTGEEPLTADVSPSKTFVPSSTSSTSSTNGCPSLTVLGKRRGSSASRYDLRQSALGSGRNTPTLTAEGNPSPIKPIKIAVTNRRTKRGTAPSTVNTPIGSTAPSPSAPISKPLPPDDVQQGGGAELEKGNEKLADSDDIAGIMTRLRSKVQLVPPSRFYDYVPTKRPRTSHEVVP